MMVTIKSKLPKYLLGQCVIILSSIKFCFSGTYTLFDGWLNRN